MAVNGASEEALTSDQSVIPVDKERVIPGRGNQKNSC